MSRVTSLMRVPPRLCLQVSRRDTANDIVLGKLAQILSYLRQGKRKRKKEKKPKPVVDPVAHQDTGLADVE